MVQLTDNYSFLLPSTVERSTSHTAGGMPHAIEGPPATTTRLRSLRFDSTAPQLDVQASWDDSMRVVRRGRPFDVVWCLSGPPRPCRGRPSAGRAVTRGAANPGGPPPGLLSPGAGEDVGQERSREVALDLDGPPMNAAMPSSRNGRTADSREVRCAKNHKLPKQRNFCIQTFNQSYVETYLRPLSI